MSARQVIVLVIAAVAAIGALFLIKGIGSHPAQQAAAHGPAIVGEQVLVAAHDVQQGAALSPGDLAVATFPQASVNDQFVRLSVQPSAQADFVGRVTRRPFVQGEPIVASAVIAPDGHGFLAAQLQPGFRAVALDIEQKSAVGGFIQPNDHVDVIVTSKSDARTDGGGSQQQTHSDIILQDIRVLAIGDKTQGQTAGDHPETNDGTVAVLEMSPEDARTLEMARAMGDVSLALRGVQAETVGLRTGRARGGMDQPSGSVRVHAFGTVVGGGR
ncbi:MAG: Flp pilus assembly protein CpaB [Terricaulis sp.]